ncbi:hypothetical protein L2E82_35483 [Cichorium intybus]|uniref:Uncharacterized protein n=1 Tax=Cichorium intybus TaxID=13427 RepID=A0ACB9BNX5_CICIN|nr:hypothetical protein L2E82_35483 [Cichorium intybus]
MGRYWAKWTEERGFVIKEQHGNSVDATDVWDEEHIEEYPVSFGSRFLFSGEQFDKDDNDNQQKSHNIRFYTNGPWSFELLTLFSLRISRYEPFLLNLPI